MLLTTLSLTALLSSPAPAPTPPLPRVVRGDHGKLPWFEGGFDAALAKAKAENKLVFIDFWTDWCGWCKRLDRDTFSNDSVVAEMKDFLCLSIDAESKSGAPVAKRFAVRGYPALFVLAPDGTPEDRIGGYLPPDKFKQEIQRVRSGKGTVSGLKKAVAADPGNVVVRFDLAAKLGDLGDTNGQEAQLAEIRRLDPEGRSLPMRRMALTKVRDSINAKFQRTQQVDGQELAEFLSEEKHPELLYEGWRNMIEVRAFQAQLAEQQGRTEDLKAHRKDMRDAMRSAWKHVPEDQVGEFGNSVAWAFYEARADLSSEDKAFALQVAEKAVAAAKDAVNVIDTYAGCLHMNGKKDEALKQMERCVALDPQNPQWKDRLARLRD